MIAAMANMLQTWNVCMCNMLTSFLAISKTCTANELATREQRSRRPIGLERRRLVDVFTKIAIEFIIHHELIHISHGHGGYLKSTSAMPMILEAGNLAAQASKSADIRTLQALEMDADLNAALASLHLLLTLASNPQQVDEEIRWCFEKPGRPMLFWSLATASIIYLWAIPDELEHVKRRAPASDRTICPSVLYR